MEITLEEDDPEAMEFILRVPHHKLEDVELDLKLKQIAAVAVQADKYDCVKVLRLCVDRWTPTIETVKYTESADVDTLVYILVASYLFGLLSFSYKLISVLTTQSPNAMDKMLLHTMVVHLPAAVTGR